MSRRKQMFGSSTVYPFKSHFLAFFQGSFENLSHLKWAQWQGTGNPTPRKIRPEDHEVKAGLDDTERINKSYFQFKIRII